MLLMATLAASCAAGAEIGTLDPRPDVPPSASLPSIRLAFGDAVGDSFEVPARGRAPTVRLRNWRRTLANGFQNALAVRRKGNELEETLIVSLERASVTLVASSLLDEERASAGLLALLGGDEQQPVLLAHGSHPPPKTAVPPVPEAYAEIVYVADLVDRHGRVVGRSQGAALSKVATSQRVTASEVVQSAVESMIERIIADLPTISRAHDASRWREDVPRRSAGRSSADRGRAPTRYRCTSESSAVRAARHAQRCPLSRARRP